MRTDLRKHAASYSVNVSGLQLQPEPGGAQPAAEPHNNNFLLASYCEPPLTTVAQLKHEAGRLAAQYLLEWIDGRYQGGSRETLMGIRLVVRQSAIIYERI